VLDLTSLVLESSTVFILTNHNSGSMNEVVCRVDKHYSDVLLCVAVCVVL
jgi:hypothetical protein